MESEILFESQKQRPSPSTQSPSHFRRIWKARHRHPLSLWTFCAVTSLLTSKHLLVNRGVDYPVQIHILQSALLTVVTLVRYLRRRRPERSEETSTSLTIPAWICLVLLATLMALSVGFTLQAILHLPNTTTLVMLTTLSCLAEMIILSISSRSINFKDYLQFIAIGSTCTAILGCEYRLLIKGIQSSLTALVGSGLARALYSMAVDKSSKVVSDPRRLNLVVSIASLVVSIIWQVFIWESWRMMRDNFQWGHAPFLIINLLSTVAAMILGKSILFPILRAEQHLCAGPRTVSRTTNITTIFFMTGVMGVYSTFTAHRSYTAFWQMLAFVAALFSAGGRSAYCCIQNTRRDAPQTYTKVDSSIQLQSMDSDNGTEISDNDTDWSNDTQLSPDQIHERSSLPSRLVFFLASALMLLFSIRNFSEWTLSPSAPTIHPILDTAYNTTTPLEIVISMYKESITEVTDLITSLLSIPTLSNATVRIYTKDAGADLDHIQSLTSATNITYLPNIGREGETYLHHILTQWDSLAHQTIFLQANIHNPREFYPRIRDYFLPGRTGMLNLGWSGNVCTCHSCTDRWQFTDPTHLFPTIHSRIHNPSSNPLASAPYTSEYACTDVLLSYKGQFIVSAARIRAVPVAVYHDLREAFANEHSWAHQQEFLRGRYDSMDNPFFGYTMERLWNLLFQCETGDVAWKCPTLLSGRRIGGDSGDCQCFDGDVE